MDGNLQMNSSSGSEFALRVALCDMVQRLKRSEFMCKYLEQCRNELANEVIKLRSHNNLLLRELTENPQKSNPFNQNQVSSPNQLDHQPDQNEYKKSVKLDSIVDENWEEITNRLINELKKEILVAESEEHNQLNQTNEMNQEKKSTLCSSGSNYFDLKSDQNADNLAATEANEYETQEQHMAINDLNDVKVDDLNRELLDKEILNKELGRELTQQQQSPSNQDKLKLTFKLLEDYSIMNNTTNNNLKVIEVHEHKDQKSNIHDLLKEYLKQQDKNPKQLELVEKLLHNFNLDLEEITRQIMVQNDKLIKLKGKQIRNYFRRQLDINNKTTSAAEPSSELKIKE